MNQQSFFNSSNTYPAQVTGPIVSNETSSKNSSLGSKRKKRQEHRNDHRVRFRENIEESADESIYTTSSGEPLFSSKPITREENNSSASKARQSDNKTNLGNTDNQNRLKTTSSSVHDASLLINSASYIDSKLESSGAESDYTEEKSDVEFDGNRLTEDSKLLEDTNNMFSPWSHLDETRQKYCRYFQMLESLPVCIAMKVKSGVAGDIPSKDSFPIFKSPMKWIGLYWGTDINKDDWSVLFYSADPKAPLEPKFAVKVLPVHEITEVFQDARLSSKSFRIYRSKEVNSFQILKKHSPAAKWANSIFGLCQLIANLSQDEIRSLFNEYTELMRAAKGKNDSIDRTTEIPPVESSNDESSRAKPKQTLFKTVSLMFSSQQSQQVSGNEPSEEIKSTSRFRGIGRFTTFSGPIALSKSSDPLDTGADLENEKSRLYESSSEAKRPPLFRSFTGSNHSATDTSNKSPGASKIGLLSQSLLSSSMNRPSPKHHDKNNSETNNAERKEATDVEELAQTLLAHYVDETKEEVKPTVSESQEDAKKETEAKADSEIESETSTQTQVKAPMSELGRFTVLDMLVKTSLELKVQRQSYVYDSIDANALKQYERRLQELKRLSLSPQVIEATGSTQGILRHTSNSPRQGDSNSNAMSNDKWALANQAKALSSPSKPVLASSWAAANTKSSFIGKRDPSISPKQTSSPTSKLKERKMVNYTNESLLASQDSPAKSRESSLLAFLTGKPTNVTTTTTLPVTNSNSNSNIAKPGNKASETHYKGRKAFLTYASNELSSDDDFKVIQKRKTSSIQQQQQRRQLKFDANDSNDDG